MPCSCSKTNLSDPIIIASPSSVTYLQHSVKSIHKVGDASSAQFLDNFDFTPTIAPGDKCFVCAFKHMCYALILIQRRYLSDFCIGAAQAALAGIHYTQHNPLLREAYNNLALNAIINLNDSQAQATQFNLAFDFSRSLFKGQQAKLDPTLFSLQSVQRQKQLFAQSILSLCIAYSLLYTEPGYQQLNNDYAIGYLQQAAAAPMLITDYPDYRNRIRILWKLVQQAPLKGAQGQQQQLLFIQLLQKVIQAYMKRYFFIQPTTNIGPITKGSYIIYKPVLEDSKSDSQSVI